MKFSTVFTALVVVVPLFSGQALAAAQGNKGFGKGSKGAPPPAKNNNNAASNNSTATNNNTATNNSTATNNNAASNNNGDPQTSLTLVQSAINTGSEQNGNQNATAGQADSLTSNNNFINDCAGKVLTNGQQIKTGSCNGIPMGDISAVTNMPAATFLSPTNGEDLAANQTFNIVLGVQGMQTGSFTDAQTTYFSAPAQLNAQGQNIGHNHISCQAIKSLTDTSIPDPQQFAFFKGLNDAAVNGALTATVTNGLSPGFYRCCSITTTSNHACINGPVAQRGSFEDCCRFSVGQGNGGNVFTGNSGNSGNTNNASTQGGDNNSTVANGGNNNSTVANGGNNSTVANGGNNNSTVANGGNNKSTGKIGGNVKNTGKNGGNAKNGKGAGGRRRMVARLSRDH